MKTSDHILASAMNHLADSIVSDDGVANAAIREAGQRITELAGQLSALRADLDAAITSIDQGEMDAFDAADYLRGVIEANDSDQGPPR